MPFAGLSGGELRVDAPNGGRAQVAQGCEGRGANALMVVPVNTLPPGLGATTPWPQARRLGQETASAIPARPASHFDDQNTPPTKGVQMPRPALIPSFTHQPGAQAVPALLGLLLELKGENFLVVAMPSDDSIAFDSYTHRGHVGRCSTSWPHFLIKSQFPWTPLISG